MDQGPTTSNTTDPSPTSTQLDQESLEVTAYLLHYSTFFSVRFQIRSRNCRRSLYMVLIQIQKNYSIFTTAGYRKSYERIYKINLHLDNHKIQLDPHPTFLGIELDPKLFFKAHLDASETKITAKLNLIKTIKGLNINSININKILFKSLIRSIFDYMAIILPTSTQKILNSAPKLGLSFVLICIFR